MDADPVGVRRADGEPGRGRLLRRGDGARWLAARWTRVRTAAPLVLEAGDVRATIDCRPTAGASRSLVVGGHELLVTGDPDRMRWGSYPMVPFAGRIRGGRFSFRGVDHQLPLGMPPHAIHGVVYDRPWRVEDATTLSIELDDRWPFRGRAVQRFAARRGRDDVRADASRRASRCRPPSAGTRGSGASSSPAAPPVIVEFAADEMLVRDAEGIPNGERIAPPPGPWDDAFIGVHRDPALLWPGQLRLVAVVELPVVGRLHGARSTRCASSPRAVRRTPSTGRRRSWGRERR